jgi:hypothetical protein
VAPIILLSSRGGMYMNDALLTVDGGRLMVSARRLRPFGLNAARRVLEADSQVAGVDDGIRLPDHYYTA